MIGKVIEWLKNHKFINLVLVLLYVAFVVFAHDAFVQLSIFALERLSLPIYNAIVAVIGVIVLLFLALSVYRASKQNVELDKSGLPFLAVTLAALIIHFFVFTEMNIEFIHAAEFGILGFLLYPLLERYNAVSIIALPILCLDEWYQYQVLYPGYVEYFDFNDLQMDLLGIGLVLSLLKTFNFSLPDSGKLSAKPALVVLFGYAVLAVSMVTTGVIALYPDQASESTWLVLNQISEPYGFWRLHPDTSAYYHVLEPVVGSLVVLGWCVFYSFMDSIKLAK